MWTRYRSSYFLLFLYSILSCITFSLAATPTLFCKCTCFSNSTIIPLDPNAGESVPSIHNTLGLYVRNLRFRDADRQIEDIRTRKQKYHALTCNDCNRKFCLDYQLPTCQGAKEEDVFTTCFQRDSKKDEAVVFIFVFATTALLAWAICKPWVKKYVESARERRSYIPVSQSSNN